MGTFQWPSGDLQDRAAYWDINRTIHVTEAADTLETVMYDDICGLRRFRCQLALTFAMIFQVINPLSECLKFSYCHAVASQFRCTTKFWLKITDIVMVPHDTVMMIALWTSAVVISTNWIFLQVNSLWTHSTHCIMPEMFSAARPAPQLRTHEPLSAYMWTANIQTFTLQTLQ